MPATGGSLREALLKASLEVITEGGVPALTLREIGRRLGVSRMAAYRHFSDKSAILGALSEIGFTRLADALECALQRRKGPFARLEELGVEYVRFANQHPPHFSLMFGGSGVSQVITDPVTRKAADRAFLVIQNAVWQAQEAGKISGHDPHLTANMVWATLHGISVLGLERDWRGEAAFTRQSVRQWRKRL